METVITQHTIDHPLEELLDIAPGTTLVDRVEITPNSVVPTEYDDKDDEIDGKLETIYAVAMAAAADNQDIMETVEGKYKARVSEVTATMLNVALGAIKEKAAIKQHKDKLKPASTDGQPQVVNNTLITASFSDMVKALRK